MTLVTAWYDAGCRRAGFAWQMWAIFARVRIHLGCGLHTCECMPLNGEMGDAHFTV